MEKVLKNGNHKSPLRYKNVNWFVNDVIKIEKEMAFYFKNTKKDRIKTEEDVEDYGNNNICRFCEKNIECDKVRDIVATYQVNIEVQLQANEILLLLKIKVVLYQLYFTILVIMIVIYLSRI